MKPGPIDSLTAIRVPAVLVVAPDAGRGRVRGTGAELAGGCTRGGERRGSSFVSILQPTAKTITAMIPPTSRVRICCSIFVNLALPPQGVYDCGPLVFGR